MRTPKTATYRLQLTPEFGFDDVCKQVDYLCALGVSDVYTSPYLQPTKGSTHGYDVVDPTRVNQELGGEAAHQRMCETLQAKALGHVIDFVPNHMAIAGEQNPWWWDVLENGPSSYYATYFDVDWENTEERWQNKILLPVLGDHYGRVLEAGELKLSHQRACFALHYFEHVFPIDPSSLAGLLEQAAITAGSDRLAFLAESYRRMPRPSIAANKDHIERRHRDKKVLFLFLSEYLVEYPQVASAIDAEIEKINSNPDRLDTLIDEQNYRLAFWRTATHDLGYRRFFDIADLAGLRIEDEAVFRDAHQLPLSWVRQGWVQGIRLDHSDGLRDPKAYFTRLRRECPDTWIVTEKILEPGEDLRRDWPIEGTTGYEFLNTCMQLFVDAASEKPMTELVEIFTGEEIDFHSVVQRCKEQVINELLQSELHRLTNLFVNICERHRRMRDFSKSELFEVLSAVATCFPVYRSYVSPLESELHENDYKYIDQAIKTTEDYWPEIDPELLQFLKSILCLGVNGQSERELAFRFQQLTGPVMAKGLEDTAFYRYTRLLALNEVGGNPGQYGASVDEFHEFAEMIQLTRPRTMLTSTTHDTKRSEDVRARLMVISEIPQRWAEAIQSWRSLNSQHNTSELPGDVEYFYYQTLVGAWPISEERMQAYMEKALREAKRYTSWTAPEEAFESAVAEFIKATLSEEAFCQSVAEFVEGIATAGYINALAQTLIKLTAPGVPDIYQGNELWDFSLVDPDNRRPVDFERRAQMLQKLESAACADIVADMASGLPKLWLTSTALKLREQYAEVFAEGRYSPLSVEGEYAEHVIAFCRGDSIAVIVPRLNLSRPEGWKDTRTALPAGTWWNAFTGEELDDGELALQPLLNTFPVALLYKKELVV